LRVMGAGGVKGGGRVFHPKKEACVYFLQQPLFMSGGAREGGVEVARRMNL
jgi:hypothetical protein